MRWVLAFVMAAVFSTTAWGASPQPCPHASSFVGKWRFTTRVDRAKSARALGINGFYEIEISQSNCNLQLNLEKTGYGRKVWPPAKRQKASARLNYNKEGGAFAHLKVEGRNASYEMDLWLVFDGAGLLGAWTYTGTQLERTGFAGTLRGERGHGTRVVYKEANVSPKQMAPCVGFNLPAFLSPTQRTTSPKPSAAAMAKLNLIIEKTKRDFEGQYNVEDFGEPGTEPSEEDIYEYYLDTECVFNNAPNSFVINYGCSADYFSGGPHPENDIENFSFRIQGNNVSQFDISDAFINGDDGLKLAFRKALTESGEDPEELFGHSCVLHHELGILGKSVLGFSCVHRLERDGEASVEIDYIHIRHLMKDWALPTKLQRKPRR